ncbi:hypothetical protein GCM10010169_41650 [Micromonospora fulviviridis]|nr:hypothetical protein GCM10010169_41650 [Micromonospora fulviviridis]
MLECEWLQVALAGPATLTTATPVQPTVSVTAAAIEETFRMPINPPNLRPHVK